jgi:hypothetical protein
MRFATENVKKACERVRIMSGRVLTILLTVMPGIYMTRADVMHGDSNVKLTMRICDDFVLYVSQFQMSFEIIFSVRPWF